MGRDVSEILGCQAREVRTKLRLHQQEFGLPYWYRNGDLAMVARLTDRLKVAFRDVTRLQDYGPPANLDGWQRLAQTMVVTTGHVAGVSIEDPFRQSEIRRRCSASRGPRQDREASYLHRPGPTPGATVAA